MHYLEHAIAIQRRPVHEWEARLAALPPDAQGPVRAWLAANPTVMGRPCPGLVVFRGRENLKK